MTSTPAPPIVFLGVAERAAYVTEGDTHIAKWNVIGLKHVILTYILPQSLAGLYFGFALPPGPPPQLDLRVVDERGAEVGRIALSAQSEPVPTGLPTAAIAETVSDISRPPLVVPRFGWMPFFLQFPSTAFLIQESGNYFLELIDASGASDRIGVFTFVVVDPLPLSPERIAAIRSDPHSTKAVRVEFACRNCGTSIKAYAALERLAQQEAEGYVWYQDLPESMVCSCRSTPFNLRYIRTNLHGILGDHTSRPDESVSLQPLYDTAALNEVRKGLLRILDRSAREEDVQAFIEANEVVLHQFPAVRMFKKPPILTDYVADFAILTPQAELLLIELERPKARLLKKNGDEAANLHHALDQIHRWLDKVDEHRLAVLAGLRIDRSQVSAVRGVVVAGRDKGYDPEALRRLKGVDRGRVRFLTYDDLATSLSVLAGRVQRI